MQEETPKLPENFAEKLLDLETQIDVSCTVTLINELMQLYSVNPN